MAQTLLTTAEAAKELNVSQRTLETLRYRGDGPRFVRVGRRTVRYPADELDRYVQTRLRRSTSDPGPGIA